MQYLIDTSVCIMYLNRRSASIQQRLLLESENVAVCSVVRLELLYGGWRSNNPQRTLEIQRQFLDQFISLLFDDAAADICARVRANLATLGTPIGSNDLQIAAIALANNLTLVTHNTGEFSRVEGLKLEDWEVGES
jgi:tRNA(fMet)-specific endonuclease VapC